MPGGLWPGSSEAFGGFPSSGGLCPLGLPARYLIVLLILFIVIILVNIGGGKASLGRPASLPDPMCYDFARWLRTCSTFMWDSVILLANSGCGLVNAHSLPVSVPFFFSCFFCSFLLLLGPFWSLLFCSLSVLLVLGVPFLPSVVLAHLCADLQSWPLLFPWFCRFLLNTQGLNSPVKRRKILQHYHSQKADILLQETYFPCTYNTSFVHNKFPKFYLANTQDKSKCVAIFFSKRIALVPIQEIQDPDDTISF